MLAIKSRILRIWDTAAPGVQICCVKFAQRVVLVQTRGSDANPRVWDGNTIFCTEGLTYAQRDNEPEVSLAIVPPGHPLVPPKNLEAEASGLLDRMLSVFQENLR
jgi:symplekin